MASADDRELVLRTQRGDIKAFGELMCRHQVAVFNVAYRMLGNRRDAEDATQETFLRAFRAFEGFDPERPLAPWLKKITTRLCLNWLASSHRRRVVTVTDIRLPDEKPADMDRWPDDQSTPERELLDQETAASVRMAILRLPPHYRAVVELRHFQELSYEDIAATLGRSLGNVKSDLFRARRLLAQFLMEERTYKLDHAPSSKS